MEPKGGEKNSESRLKKSVFSQKTVGDSISNFLTIGYSAIS